MGRERFSEKKIKKSSCKVHAAGQAITEHPNINGVDGQRLDDHEPMLVLLYGHERVTGARIRLSDTDISRRNEPVNKKKSQLRRGRYLGTSPHTYCMSLRVSQPAEGAGYLCNMSDPIRTSCWLFDVIPLRAAKTSCANGTHHL